MSENIVIPHPCFIESVAAPVGCKDALGLAGKRVLLAFGFIEPHKGIDRTLRALVPLPGDVVLLVAGAPRTAIGAAYYEALKKDAATLGVARRVVFHGYVEPAAIPVVMGASDIAVMPYRESVQSGAVYMPLAHGVPVVASNIGGFRELAAAGVIETYDPSDVDGLRRTINDLLANPGRMDALRRRGLEYCRETSMEKTRDRLLEIYYGWSK